MNGPRAVKINTGGGQVECTRWLKVSRHGKGLMSAEEGLRANKDECKRRIGSLCEYDCIQCVGAVKMCRMSLGEGPGACEQKCRGCKSETTLSTH